MPELWVTCALGPYNFEFMTEVTKEIVALYKVDGVFSNRWAASGCATASTAAKISSKATGLDLPRTNNPQDPSAARVHRMAPAAPVRTVAAVGH